MPSKVIDFANDVWPFVIFRPLINVRKCREVIYILRKLGFLTF